MKNRIQAEQLTCFCTTLFGENGKVAIFPMVRDKDKVLRHIADNGSNVVGTKQIAYERDGEWIPRNCTSAFFRKASLIDATLVGNLKELSGVGFDIFFAINPLTCSQRCQKTVVEGRHILLECDDEDIPPEEQRKIFMKYQDHIAAITSSGSKSVHALLRLDPPLDTPFGYGFNQMKYVPKGDRKFTWNEYISVAWFWISTLRSDGLKIDVKPAVDCARVSRLPGFPHSKTNHLSECLYLNPTASYNPLECLSDIQWQENSPDIVGDNDEILDNIDILQSQSISSDDKDNIVLGSNNDNIVIITNSPLSNGSRCSRSTGSGLVMEKKKTETFTYNVTQFRPSFLDHLDTYHLIKSEGIPSRHVRRSLHPAFFCSAQIYGMTDEQMEVDWRSIVAIHPNNIGCSSDEAVTEMTDALSLWRTEKPYMPNWAVLPDIGKERLKDLKTRLKEGDCPHPQSACNILEKVLWPAMRELPMQCWNGTLGISAKRLNSASRCYRRTFDWMIKQRLVSVTDEGYMSGRTTRRYKINLFLIVYWLQFKADDLNWEVYRKDERWYQVLAA